MINHPSILLQIPEFQQSSEYSLFLSLQNSELIESALCLSAFRMMSSFPSEPTISLSPSFHLKLLYLIVSVPRSNRTQFKKIRVLKNQFRPSLSVQHGKRMVSINRKKLSCFIIEKPHKNGTLKVSLHSLKIHCI